MCSQSGTHKQLTIACMPWLLLIYTFFTWVLQPITCLFILAHNYGSWSYPIVPCPWLSREPRTIHRHSTQVLSLHPLSFLPGLPPLVVLHLAAVLHISLGLFFLSLECGCHDNREAEVEWVRDTVALPSISYSSSYVSSSSLMRRPDQKAGPHTPLRLQICLHQTYPLTSPNTQYAWWLSTL